jgi:oligoribonuclease (3'-5' exoribonuclease)
MINCLLISDDLESRHKDFFIQDGKEYNLNFNIIETLLELDVNNIKKYDYIIIDYGLIGNIKFSKKDIPNNINKIILLKNKCKEIILTGAMNKMLIENDIQFLSKEMNEFNKLKKFRIINWCSIKDWFNLFTAMINGTGNGEDY